MDAQFNTRAARADDARGWHEAGERRSSMATPLLPNFLIIGASKSGTTSLHHYLNQHPDVFLPDVKEPMFFLLCDGTSVYDYVASPAAATWGVSRLEDYQRLFEPGRNCSAIGEASTLYLPVAKAAAQIDALLPTSKIIVILRDPTERAFSHYQMLRRWGVESAESFEDAIDAEPARIAQGWAVAWQYVGLGFYAEQLQPFLRRFGEARVKVYWHEDLSRSPADVLADMFTFLGVGPDVSVDTRERLGVSQQARWPRVERMGHSDSLRRVRGRIPDRARALSRRARYSRPRMSSKMRSRLIAVFRDDIRELETLTGRCLDGWLR